MVPWAVSPATGRPVHCWGLGGPFASTRVDNITPSMWRGRLLIGLQEAFPDTPPADVKWLGPAEKAAKAAAAVTELRRDLAEALAREATLRAAHAGAS